MVINLTREQESWLAARVAVGEFATVEDAARSLIDGRIAEIGDLEDDDFAWAKPRVDAAREAAARGEVMTLEDHKARVADHLRVLFGR
jgi:antitoxin ParD1/3/4